MAKATTTATTSAPPASSSWHGSEALRSLLVPIDAVRKDERNARSHDERSHEGIRTSLRRFGQRKPIVVRNGVVVAGNGTLEAARREGWTHLAVVDAVELSDEEAQAFAIADNRTAELSEWNFEALSLSLKELPEALRLDVGFAAYELEPLLRAEWTPPAAGELPQSPGRNHSLVFDDAQWDLVQRALTKMEQLTGAKAASVVDGVVGALKRFVIT